MALLLSYKGKHKWNLRFVDCSSWLFEWYRLTHYVQ